MLTRRLETPLAAAVLVVGCTLAAYANAFLGSFQFDDWNVIVDNPAVHSWPGYWSRMPGIRPLLKATYTANWTSGLGVAGFHAVNVALHAVNALLVLTLARRLAPVLGAGDVAVPVSLVTALLFALHPAQTEVVTYVCGRSVGLMATFYLAAIVAHLRSERALDVARLIAVASFVAACASKETAWTLPLALVLVEKARGRSWRDAARATAAYWLTLAAIAVAASFVPGYWRLLGASLETRTLGENLLTQIDGQFYLITRPLLALYLNADPDLVPRSDWSAGLAAQAACLAALVATAVLQWRARRWLAFGLLWLFVHLLATNSMLPRYDVANDRQLYLALAGPALVAAVALARLPRPGIARIALVAVCAVLGTATVWRNLDYRSETAFWEATAARSPGKARVWNNLGYARQLAGDLAGARAAYERAIALDPDDPKARINLSTLGDAPQAAPAR